MLLKSGKFPLLRLSVVFRWQSIRGRVLHSSLFAPLLILCCLLSFNARGQHTWKKGDCFCAFVYCNGVKVEANYRVRGVSTEVSLGFESYSKTAIDTTLAGSLEVPQQVTSPDGHVFFVTSISRHALADCRRLTAVVLPDSIHDIGDQSFMNCSSLRSIVVPCGTRFIWPYAFRGCGKLQRIEVRAVVPPDSYNDVFDEHTLRFATLIVPAASADAYRNAFVWNMFRYSTPDFAR